MNYRTAPIAFAVAAAFLIAAPVRAQNADATAPAPTGFPDVPPDHWAADAVGKLGRAGILKGYPRGTTQRAGDRGYDGNRPVTRYELAVTLWRFVQYIEGADRQKRGGTAAPSGAAAVRQLIAGGYLPANTPLGREGGKPVTADQFSDALARTLARVTERRTPITPDSLRAPAQRPAAKRSGVERPDR